MGQLRRFKAILFDLFDTIVHFAPQVPRVEHGGEHWRSTMGWLSEAVAAELPGVRFDEFLQSMLAVTAEMKRRRAPEFLEVSSHQRFERILQRLGIDEQRAVEIAPRLSAVHMRHLASQTLLPDGHLALLQSLQRQYQVGLISNFDHQPTAHAILRQHAIDRFFDPIVISDGFGRRKPHPAIFLDTLRRMQVEPSEALYVGDSPSDDVLGAHNAGVAVVWISSAAGQCPPHVPAPMARIASLLELPALLQS